MEIISFRNDVMMALIYIGSVECAEGYAFGDLSVSIAILLIPRRHGKSGLPHVPRASVTRDLFESQ